MKRWTYILLCLITSISAISCTETPDCREFQVPEIVSITSLPDVHSAVLISDLQTAPSGKIEVGFYIGKNRAELKRIYTTLSGKSFRLSVNDLEDGTNYFFKAFVTNGRNEIASAFESFITETEPVIPSDPVLPEDPDTPDVPEPENPENPGSPDEPTEPDEPENPDEPTEPDEPDVPDEPTEPGNPEEPGRPDEPTEPENPDEPEVPGEPEDPTEPDTPVEFTVEITGISASFSNDILELSATLEGDISQISECWFMVGTDPEKLTRIKGAVEGGMVKAYLAGLEKGTYHYKAVISDGSTTKESDMDSYIIE